MPVPIPEYQGQVLCQQIGKDQNVRRMDTFFLGPMMIRVGWQKRKAKPLLGWTLIAAGLGTIFYNRRNFMIQEQVKRQIESAPPPTYL